MDNNGKSITILTHKHSVVVRGIEGKLRSFGYEVTVVEDKFEEAGSYLDDTNLFMIYLQGDILDDSDELEVVRNALHIIKDADKNMIILGEASFHDDCMRALPEIYGYHWINRPVDMEMLEEIVANEIKHGTSGNKKRILIVDDDPYYAEMVREWISDVYNVDIAPAGMQAISFLIKLQETKKVDLILLDYEMPILDGPQVLQMLRQEKSLRDIPVIFLTGNGAKDAVTKVMALKPAGYILKAVKREDLLMSLHDKIGH